MKREVDREGNIVIRGLPRQVIQPSEYQFASYRGERTSPSTARGPFLFGIAVLSVLVCSSVLAYMSVSGGFDSAGNDTAGTMIAGSGIPTASMTEVERGLQLDDTRSAMVTGRQVPVSIHSDPEGARVLVDYERIGSTPIQNHLLAEGVYVISVGFEGGAVKDSVIILGDEPSHTVSFRLGPPAQPSESGTELMVGNAAIGDGASQQLPQTSAASDTGPPEVQRAPTSRSTQETPLVEASGSLRIASNPSGASVLLNGDPRGRTPLEIADLRPAEYNVTLSLDGYAEEQMRLRVAPSRTTRTEQNLEALTGTLNVLVEPWGTIYVDDQFVARDTDIRHTLTLPVGVHRISVSHPVLGERIVSVNVQASRSHDVTVDLTNAIPASNR